jgi:hypothetical protein
VLAGSIIVEPAPTDKFLRGKAVVASLNNPELQTQIEVKEEGGRGSMTGPDTNTKRDGWLARAVRTGRADSSGCH